MPELQQTIADCGLSATEPTSGPLCESAAPQRPPLASYCECGAPAITENANGSACADCDEEFGNLVECNDCNELVDPDDCEERDGNTVCSGCDENWTNCNDCNCDILNDDTHTAGGNEVCSSCRDNNYFRCDGCREYDSNDNCNSDENNSYCDSCFESMDRCDSCSCITSNDSTTCVGDNTYCESCYSDNCFYCEGCSEPHEQDDEARCSRCQNCWDNLNDDERADLIVEVERGGGISRPSGSAVTNNPVVQNRPSNSACCQPRPFAPLSNSSARCGSFRPYGVELETSSCPGAAGLSGRTVFTSKMDGTVTGWEFVSEHLNGDAGLDAIEQFCELAEEASFAVNSACGFHAHFDISDLSDEQRYNVLFAYWMFRDVWRSFVSEARRDEYYCSPTYWRPVVYRGTINRIEWRNGDKHRDYDIRDVGYSEFAASIDKYHWINPKSVVKHNTIEVRLHAGTISAKKVNLWVIAHIRFIDFMSNLSREAIVREFHGKASTTLFAALLELMPADVATHLTGRCENFGGIIETAPIDTTDSVEESEDVEESEVADTSEFVDESEDADRSVIAESSDFEDVCGCHMRSCPTNVTHNAALAVA